MLASAIRRDEVADALREAILDGRLAPGDRLVEDRVMEWLGATRSGARKAFRRLEHEGLVHRSGSWLRLGVGPSRAAASTIGS